MAPSPPMLFDVARERMRLRHLSPRTSDAYLAWMRRFVRFHRGRHPRTMSADDVTAFLSYLASTRNVSSSTQNQALAALLFLFEKVLDRPLGAIEDVVRAKRPARVPVVMSRDEVRRLLDAMSGTPRLVTHLLYGT